MLIEIIAGVIGIGVMVAIIAFIIIAEKRAEKQGNDDDFYVC